MVSTPDEMAIHRSGLFDHRAALHRTLQGIWRGRAEPNDLQDALVGDAPTLELSNGTLTLIRSQRSIRSVFGREPVHRASIQVGTAFEAVLEDGDVIATRRDGTGDLAATLSRNNQILQAMGAVEREVRNGGIAIDTDRRAYEVKYYGAARSVGRRGVQLLWFDSSAQDLDSQLTALERVPPGVTMLITIARADEESRLRELNRLIFSHLRSTQSISFEVAPEGITTLDEFLAFLEQLPDERPSDLVLRFTIDGQQYEVREREYQSHDPWHLLVARVYTPGIPGELSQFGVARMHPNLSVETFTSSVQEIASNRIQFDR